MDARNPEGKVFRLTYVFKRSRAPFVARDLVSKRGCSRALYLPPKHGCSEARPKRTGPEQDSRLQRPSAESAETRGPSEARPQRLKCSYAKLASGAKATIFETSDAVPGYLRESLEFQKIESSRGLSQSGKASR